MDGILNAPPALTLPLLALIDGLSVGTLLIPLFLLLAPGRPAVGRILTYLGTITGFYVVVGILLSFGIVNMMVISSDFLSSTGGAVLRLLLGVALLIAAFVMPGGRKKPVADEPGEVPRESAGLRARWTAVPRVDRESENAGCSVADPSASDAQAAGGNFSYGTPLDPPFSDVPTARGQVHAHSPLGAQAARGNSSRTAADPVDAPADAHASSDAVASDLGIEPRSRIGKWRDALLAERVAPFAVAGVALAAGLIEVATMLPYIAAMTILADTGMSFVPRTLVIIGYGLVMILPALVLLLIRVVARERVDSGLRKLAAWVYRASSGETMAWIIGIIGFLIARSAAVELDLFERIGDLAQLSGR